MKARGSRILSKTASVLLAASFTLSPFSALAQTAAPSTPSVPSPQIQNTIPPVSLDRTAPTPPAAPTRPDRGSTGDQGSNTSGSQSGSTPTQGSGSTGTGGTTRTPPAPPTDQTPTGQAPAATQPTPTTPTTPNPLTPPPPSSPSTAPTISGPNAFTYTSSAAKVDSTTGALTQHIVLDIPPGRKGLQPDLALDYNSQRTQDSIVGYGWSLSIPYVERLNKTGSENLYNAPYYSSSLDGELATTSTSTYRAKIDDGTFRSYSYANNTWTMYDKNGTRYLFGASTQSRVMSTSTSAIGRWMLEEVRDTNNNYVKYVYTSNGNQLYPSQIIYTGHNSTDGSMEIDFTTASRSDVRESRAYGFPVITNYRISEIDAKVSGTIVRKYLLSYGTGNNGLRSLLTSIQEEGYDDSQNLTTLPAMTFTYTSASLPFYTPSKIGGNGMAANGSAYPIADTDGNGINDVNHFYYNYNTSTSTGDVLFNQGSSVSSVGTVPDWWSTVNPTNTVEGGTRYLDVNADGKADLIKGELVSGSGTSTVEFLNQGGGTLWASSTYSGVIPVFAYFDNTNTISAGILGDVNGDGLPDLESWQDYTSAIPKASFLGNGSAWDAATTTIFVPPQYASKLNPSPTASQLVDVNGDGLDDWVYSDGTNIYVLLNTGTGWSTTPASQWTIATSTLYHSGTSYYDRGIRFMDLNGDGLPDFVRSYSLNNSGLCSGVNAAEVFSASYAMMNTGNGWGTSTPETFSQYIENGNTDTCGFLGTFNYNEFGNWNGNGQMNQDVISSITYPRGGSTNVTYTPSAQLGTDTALPISFLVVTELSTNDNRGNTATTDYGYSGGKMYLAQGPRERKFAGFAWVAATSSNSATNTYYNQGDGVNTGMGEQSDGYGQINHPYRIDVVDPATGALVQRTYNRWDTYAHASSTFVALGSQMIESYNSDGTHKDKATNYTYASSTDDLIEIQQFGQVTGSSNGTFTDTGSDDRTTYVTYAASSTLNLSVPATKIIDDNSNATSTRSNFYYDSLGLGSVSAGNQTKEEDWVTGNQYASTTAAYNTYGLPTQQTDARGKATLYGYDIYNFYAASSTDPLSHITLYTYNYANGKAKQITDPNGAITKNTYDGVGRLTETDQSDTVTPSSTVTQKTFAYTDNTTTPSIVHEADYLNSATTTDAYSFYDGLDRLIQQRTSAESSGTYNERDKAYNLQGLVATDTVPYLVTSSSFGGPTSTPAFTNTYAYDPLGRITSAGNVTGTTTTAYTDWAKTVTDPNGNSSKKYYNDAYDNLAQVDEVIGGGTNSTYYTYDGANDLTNITDASGNVRNFTYDGLGRRLTAQDLHASADGTYGSWTYTYDDGGNMLSQTDPKNQVVNWTYDDLSRPLTEDYTGTSGTDVTNTYDTCTNGVGHLCTASSTSAKMSYAYDVLGRTTYATSTIAGTSYVMGYGYDRQGNITSLTYPNSAKASYLYTPAGTISALTRKGSGSSSWSSIESDLQYSPLEMPTQRLFGNGATTTWTYAPTQMYRLTGLQTFATSSASIIPNPDSTALASSSLQYWNIADASQTGLGITGDLSISLWVKPTSQPDGTHLGHEMVSKWGASGHNSYQVYYYWNGTGTELDFGIHSSSAGNSTASWATTLSVNTWYHLVYVYSASGGTADLYINGTHQTQVTGLHNDIATSDAALTVGADSSGNNNWDGKIDDVRVWSRTLSSTEVSALYNNPGTASNGASLQGWWKFDGDGTDASGNSNTLTNNNSATFSSDVPWGSTGGAGAPAYVQNLTYTYDKNGNITNVSESAGSDAHRTVGYLYDALNRMTAASTTVASTSPYTYSYTYDPLGNITNFSSTAASTNQWTYSQGFESLSNGALSGQDSWTGSTLPQVESTLAYDGSKALETIDDDSQPIVSRSITPISSGTVRFAFQKTVVAVDDNELQLWHGASEVTSISFHNGNIKVLGYTLGTYATSTWYLVDLQFDASTHLTRARVNNGAWSPWQNFVTNVANVDTLELVTNNDGGAETNYWDLISPTPADPSGSTYAYSQAGDDNPDALTSIGSGTATTAYAYDNNGNLATTTLPASTNSYMWDYQNRITQSVTGAATTTSNATSTYAYDASGNRVSQTVGGITTNYPNKWYSIASMVVGGTTYATTTEYFYDGGALVAEVNQLLVNGTASGTPATYYIHPDNLGSTNLVTNATGTVVQTLDYYPYGASRINTGTETSPRKFIGQFTDTSGLDYLNARYYDGSRGQFLSEDPIFLASPQQQILQDPQSLNSYSYSEDNPINKSDPSGRIAGWDDLIASGVGGLVSFDVYTLQTAIASQPETLAGAANAVVSGSIMAEGIDNAPETGGTSIEAALVTIRAAANVGARAGFYGNAAEQAINIAQGNQTNVNWNALALGTVKGALTNVLLSSVLDACVPGLSCGTDSWTSLRTGISTKLRNGTISSVSARTSFKSAAGTQAAGLYRTFGGTIFNFNNNTNNNTPQQSNGKTPIHDSSGTTHYCLGICL